MKPELEEFKKDMLKPTQSQKIVTKGSYLENLYTATYGGIRFRSGKECPMFIKKDNIGRYRLKQDRKITDGWLSLPFVRGQTICFIVYTEDMPALPLEVVHHLESAGIRASTDEYLFRNPKIFVYRRGVGVIEALTWVNGWASNVLSKPY